MTVGAHRLIHEFKENLWRWKCHLPEKDLSETTLDEMMESEQWSWDFEVKRWSRMMFGGYRYGKVKHGKKSLNQLYLEAAIHKLKSYQKSGNLELLVDAANYAMLEYMTSEHPNKHFDATDDEDHCKEKL